MAGDQLNRERRALLGAALALSFETGVRRSSVPPQDERVPTGTLAAREPAGAAEQAGEEWRAALAAYLAAEAAVAGEEGRMAGASFAEAEAAQESYDRLGAAMYRALARLFAAPAPDAAALAFKLQLFAAHEAFTLDCGEEALAALTADALRLAGAAGDGR